MISAILMGAGLSKRMGDVNKLLLEIEGKPLVTRVLDAITSSNVDEVVLVYKDKEVHDIGAKYNVKCVVNDISYLGQSTSVLIGLGAADLSADGYMFLPTDIPFIDKNCINMVIDCFNNNSNKIVIPTYSGKNGNPVIFPKSLREELMTISGDTGGKAVIKNHSDIVLKIDVGNDYFSFDIDNMEDYLLAAKVCRNEKTLVL